MRLRGDHREQGLDVSISRNVTITERVRLQFHAEAFNLTNTVGFGRPTRTRAEARQV